MNQKRKLISTGARYDLIFPQLCFEPVHKPDQHRIAIFTADQEIQICEIGQIHRHCRILIDDLLFNIVVTALGKICHICVLRLWIMIAVIIRVLHQILTHICLMQQHHKKIQPAHALFIPLFLICRGIYLIDGKYAIFLLKAVFLCFCLRLPLLFHKTDLLDH